MLVLLLEAGLLLLDALALLLQLVLLLLDLLLVLHALDLFELLLIVLLLHLRLGSSPLATWLQKMSTGAPLCWKTLGG